jgi:mono/diheme cytochrome c family protein
MNPMSKAASFSESSSSPAIAGRSGLRLALLLLLGALAGCANVETIAPPVSVLKGNHTSLEAGRRIYLSQCTSCHTAEPVRDYAETRWPGILDEMSPKAKLTPPQERDVRLYVATVSKMN